MPSSSASVRARRCARLCRSSSRRSCAAPRAVGVARRPRARRRARSASVGLRGLELGRARPASRPARASDVRARPRRPVPSSARGRGDERVAHGAEAAVERAGAVEATAREARQRARRARARRRRRERGARPRRRRGTRSRRAGTASGSSGAARRRPTVTSTIIVPRRRLLERLEQLVGGGLVEAEPLGVEQRRSPCARPRSGCAYASAMICLRVLDADLRGRRVDLDDVGVHAAQREVPRALVAVGRDRPRRRSTAPPPRRRSPRGPTSRYACTGRSAARCSSATARSCPTTRAHCSVVTGSSSCQAAARPRRQTRSATSSTVAVARRPRPSRVSAARSRYAAAPRRGTRRPRASSRSRSAPRRARVGDRRRSTSSTTTRSGSRPRGRDRVRAARPRRRRARGRRPGTRATTARSGRSRPTSPRASAGSITLGDVLGAVGGHEQRLGGGCDRLGAVEQQLADHRTGRRRRRARRSRRTVDARARAARPPSRAACVLFPLPSPPSSTTNRPRVTVPLRFGRSSSVGGVGLGSRLASSASARVGRPATARPGRADGTRAALLRHRRLAGSAACARPADRPPGDEPGDERDEPPPQSARRTPGSAYVYGPIDTVWSVERALGDPVPEVGPQRRDRRARAAGTAARPCRASRTCGRASRRCTFSCSTVKPVTYDVPAHAPTRADHQRRGRERRERRRQHEEHAGADHREARTPSSRGSRFWNHSSVTTPIAAPNPSAVISTPNAALPPSSTSFAKHRAERDHRAGADEADRRGRSSRRAPSGSLRMNCSPSLISRNVSRPVDASVAVAASRRGIGSRKTMTADTRNVHRVEPRARATPGRP